MSLFSAFPFIRIFFPFVSGIILAIYLDLYSIVWVLSALFILILLLIETYWAKISSLYVFRFTSGILFFTLNLFLGITLTGFNNEKEFAEHFSKFNTEWYKGIVSGAPVEKEKSFKVILEIQNVKENGKWMNVNGKLLCYIQKIDAYTPRPGDVILFNNQVQKIENRKNPGQFDYKQYLYYHNIYHQVYLKQHQYQFVCRKGNLFTNLAYDIRKSLIQSFQQNGLTGNQLAVASALIFGATDLLDPELVRSYAGTGALHVLSVSGLHVAIIYGFLQFILSFLNHRKNGKLIVGIIILVFIWFYAMLTGLTPSVLRSSTMFTFIIVGQLLSRKSSVFNSIAASAFVLLCIDPFLIMEVGFQLSYLAVTGIILLYPIIHRQFTFHSWLPKQIWSIASVSIAAQIATFPLGLLYFHQFPNYFIFSNLLIIPISGLILYIGVTASVFYFIPPIQKILVVVLDWCIWIMNQMVSFIESLPYALLEGISISITETMLFYAIIVCWLIWYKTSQPKYLNAVLAFAVVVICLQVHEAIFIQQQRLLIVYHAPGHTAIDIVHGKEHVFISDSSFYNNPNQLLFNVKHNWDDLNLKKPEVNYTNKHLIFENEFSKSRGKYFFTGNKSFQIIDAAYDYKTDTLVQTDFLILTKNARINLTKIPFKQTTIIADASNYKTKINKWKQQADKKGIQFLDITKKGAFVLPL